MAGTAQAAVRWAQSQLGYKEGRGNRTKYADAAGHANGLAWCATFVVACMRANGVRLPSESAYTPTMANGFQRAGRWGRTPRVGAVVFFRWPSLGRIAHVGIVESVRSDGSVVCIEGNTDVAGGRTGGQVMRKVRRANIAGYGYPAYGTEARKAAPAPAAGGRVAYPGKPLRRGSRGAAVAHLQRRLVNLGNRMAVDGEFGPATERVVRIAQRNRRLAVDGIVGPATWKALGL